MAPDLRPFQCAGIYCMIKRTTQKQSKTVVAPNSMNDSLHTPSAGCRRTNLPGECRVEDWVHPKTTAHACAVIVPTRKSNRESSGQYLQKRTDVDQKSHRGHTMHCDEQLNTCTVYRYYFRRLRRHMAPTKRTRCSGWHTRFEDDLRRNPQTWIA